jgi:CDP-paratose 2-epimerase
MSVVLVTGSAGLIGAETVRFFAAEGFDVVGIDNDMRRVLFGDDASTAWSRERLQAEVKKYQHIDGDVRDPELLEAVFNRKGRAISAVIHTAAQPSDDWAARDPQTDFGINANGTLNLLEATRRHCPDAAFLFTSTNKVYGDTPNLLPLVEEETRWEVRTDHSFAAHGIDESMSIDGSLHSLFGASKLAADILGIRSLLWVENRVLSRRLPDRTRPLRHDAARVSRLSREMRRHGAALHGVRLRGQAGSRQHPFVGPGKCLLALCSGSSGRRGL